MEPNFLDVGLPRKVEVAAARETHPFRVKLTRASIRNTFISRKNRGGIAHAQVQNMGRNVKPMTVRQLRKEAGFTFWDFLVVVAAVMLLAVWAMQTLQKPKAHGTIVRCVSHLKQVGLGARIWANDHGERFPWQTPTREGGTLELVGVADAFQHFEALSNELSSLKIMVCPEDKFRTPAVGWIGATQWVGFTGNSNLSYFVGLDAVEAKPQTLLSGDRTISTNGRMASGLILLSARQPVTWAKGLHQHGGNVALADGSVMQVNDATLRKHLEPFTNAPVRLMVP